MGEGEIVYQISASVRDHHAVVHLHPLRNSGGSGWIALETMSPRDISQDYGRYIDHSPKRIYDRLMLPNVEIRLLECLVALVEESNVTAAGRRMQLSQPRMSNALRRLREICDDPILVRMGQRMRPTDRAVKIVSHVREGLAQLSLGLSQQDVFDPAQSNRSFTLMLSDYVETLLLPKVFEHISTAAPQIQIRLRQLVTGHARDALEEEGCDLLFGFLSPLKGNLRISTLLRDSPVWIARASHPMLTNSMSLEQLLDASHVMLADEPGAGSTLEQLCDAELKLLGSERRIAVHAATPYSLARIVASTDCIGTLPRKLAEEYAGALPLRILDSPLELGSFDVSMAWHERMHRDPGHVWLRSLFRELALSLDART